MATLLDDMGQLQNENNVSDSEEDKLETASESSDEIYHLASDSDVNICPDSFVGKDGSEWSSEPCIKGRTAARNIIKGGMNKVILSQGKQIDLPLDVFSFFMILTDFSHANAPKRINIIPC